MNNVWVKSANKFAIAEVSQQMEHLPVGVYKLEVETTRVYTFERTYKTHKVFTGTDLAF